MVDAEELENLRGLLAREQATQPVLHALWLAVVDDWELWQRLDAAAGGDVVDALSIAKLCLTDSVARRRCELARLERGEAGA